ncbi:MAG TPA: hypothetical protein VFH03_21985 [Actinoplanes sp.]|nr:hypothetical protein [Actinoplanes sp.]
MHINEVALVGAITLGVAGVSYLAFRPHEVAGTAERVADRATCRTVDEAIVGYLTTNDRPPRSIADLRPYVRGDISAYRIVDGRAAGPGC